MTYSFEVADFIPATPEQVYDAWMSTDGHGAMTGASAAVDPEPGGPFMAWDGYITGRTLEAERPRRLVQSWRTEEFSEEDPDSRIEVTFNREGDGTRVTIVHRGVPDGHLGYEQGGWQDNYFDPMKEYFTRSRSAGASGA